MLIDGRVQLDTSIVAERLAEAVWSHEGGTYNLLGQDPLDEYTWSDGAVPTQLWAVGVEGVSITLDYEVPSYALVEEWVKAVLAMYPQAEWFGVWHDGGRATLDLVELHRTEFQAREEGVVNKQRTIYELVEGREVTL